MAIYTKTGDAGTTGLFDGHRVAKASRRVDTYGTLDELNAHLSLCEKLVSNEESRTWLHTLQGKLFRLCAEIATLDEEKLLRYSTPVKSDEVRELEQLIDAYTKRLPPLNSFIYQGATVAAAELHIARTVCRRAERLLVALHQEEPLRAEVLSFVNRLSDCIYTLARMEDFTAYITEVTQRVLAKLDTRTAHDVHQTQGEVTMDESSWLREQVHILCKRAQTKAEAMQVPVVIAVVDAKGMPVLTYRMENALLVSSELAPGKAYTAVALKTATSELKETIQPGSDLYQIEAMVSRKLVTFGGGFPLYYKGKLVGGLGISGGMVEEDCCIGRYAMEYLEANHGK